jgi:hypothetical protein
MSYTIVKSIKIDEKNGKVFLTGACNNVSPKSFYKEESKYFSKMLQEKGREEVELYLLLEYENGNLQRGTNKYTKALKVLHYVYGNEYEKFNWRHHNAEYGSKEYDREKELRKSPEFYELLRKALKTSLSKQKLIICKIVYNGKKVYAKRTINGIRWKYIKTKATKWDFRKEAENEIKCFNNSENWRIEEF